jgi:hypothetical protein
MRVVAASYEESLNPALCRKQTPSHIISDEFSSKTARVIVKKKNFAIF